MFRTLHKLILISFKNLFRNKRRTLFTFLVAVIGFVAMGLAAGYYSFSIYGLQELTIALGFSGDGGTGHAQLMDRRNLEREEEQILEFGISDYRELQDLLQSIPGVDLVIPRVKFGGLITNSEKSTPFNGIGLEAKEEAELRDALIELKSDLRLGDEIMPLDTVEHGVILGVGLAKSLNAKIGDYLMLLGVTVDGAVNAVDVEMVGVTATGTELIDKYLVITNIPVVHRLVNTDKISLFSIKYTDRDKLGNYLATTRNFLQENGYDQFNLTPWNDLGKFYTSIKDIFNVIFLFNGLIIIVIVLLSCWNIINMTTMERSSEIGALRAIGLRIKYITSIFLIESFFIACGGVIFGLILQVGVGGLLNALKINMPPIPGQDSSYLLQIDNFTIFHPYIALAIIVSITFSGLSSFFIIRKLSIVELLDYA